MLLVITYQKVAIFTLKFIYTNEMLSQNVSTYNYLIFNALYVYFLCMLFHPHYENYRFLLQYIT